MSNYGLSLGTGAEVSGFDLGSAGLHLSLEKKWLCLYQYITLQSTAADKLYRCCFQIGLNFLHHFLECSRLFHLVLLTQFHLFHCFRSSAQNHIATAAMTCGK